MTEAELGERASPEDRSCRLKTKDLSPAGVCRVRGRRQGEMALERWPLVSPSSWASLHRRVTGAPPTPPMVTCSLGAPRGTWPEAWGLWELQDFNSGTDSVEEATQLRPGAAALQVGKAKWASSLPTPL